MRISPIEELVFAAVEQAKSAFWKSVAESFPGAVAGELNTFETTRLDNAMIRAVEEVYWNVGDSTRHHTKTPDTLKLPIKENL